MRQKVLISTVVATICVLFIVGAGCISTKEGAPAPGTQTMTADTVQFQLRRNSCTTRMISGALV